MLLSCVLEFFGPFGSVLTSTARDDSSDRGNDCSAVGRRTLRQELEREQEKEDCEPTEIDILGAMQSFNYYTSVNSLLHDMAV